MLRAPFPRTAVARRLVASGLLLGSLALTAGCGTPPELRQPSGSQRPAPATTTPTPTAQATPGVPTPRPTLSPSPTGFPEATAVACQGKPGGDQVVALVRRASSLIPRGIQVTVPAPGPLCAGDWQYTVLQVANSEPLQVVSKGPATSLTLVTVGTDVCSIPVRTEAPAGIRTAACESPPAAPPGGYTTPTPTIGA